VWQADNASSITPRHVEFYNAIYSAGNPAPAALYWEVATGVAGYDLFQPPAFFQDLRQYDRRKGTTLARRFADQLTLILLLFAAVDGLVSESEAGFVNACADTLIALCDKDGLTADRPALKADEFITRKPAASDSPVQPQQAAAQAEPSKEEAVPEPPNLDEALAKLDALCGLERVKKDVKSLINLVKVRKLRQEAGLPVPPMSLHLVFLGNPGTGKTTVARLLAEIYHALGVLSKGQLVEVDRSGLVAGFVGQTAIKTQEVVQKAIGGVLFIDEAYALVNQENGNDFGHEAIEVLLKGMEDHRNDFIVIVAGYTDLMEKFIHSNPGLESRFNKYFFFEDYDGGQLLEIFQSICQKNGYTLSKEAEDWAKADFMTLYENRDENFGNARDVRNLFEKAVARQSDRVAMLESPTKEELMELRSEDLKEPEE
jgi:SpoVK/Ycf46/Vps4 family AAA+-type ATPase